MYRKDNYTAVEIDNSNYFHLYVDGRPMFHLGSGSATKFSLKFILDMGFEEIK